MAHFRSRVVKCTRETPLTPIANPLSNRVEILKDIHHTCIHILWCFSREYSRSQIVFEVKPWEAEADLKSLFAKITAEKIPGLVWGEAYKLMPVAYGVMKLVLSCVVEDDKVRPRYSRAWCPSIPRSFLCNPGLKSS